MKLRLFPHRRPSRLLIVVGLAILLWLPRCNPVEPVAVSVPPDTVESSTRRPPPEVRRDTPTTTNPAPTVTQPVPPPPPPPPTLLTLAYGPDPAHLMDVHRRAQPNGLAVLWLHSGGWTGGERANTGPMVDRLCEHGAILFSIDYRLTPDHIFPAQIHDVKRAIRFIKGHRADWPFDHLIVAGGSAGGHLAALAATTAGLLEPTDLPPELAAQDSSVSGAISLSGPLDLTRFWRADHAWAKALSDAFLGCDSAACDETVMSQASPIHWVDVNDPPLFLVAGTADTLVTAADNADRMWQAVQQQGDPSSCWYDRLEGVGHMVDEHPDPDRVDRFLHHFGLSPPPSAPPRV